MSSSTFRFAAVHPPAVARLLLAGGVVLALAPARLQACATCFGQSDDAMAKGMNMGIFSLLIVVTFVLGGFAAFGIFLVRRAARFAAQAGLEAVGPAGSVDADTLAAASSAASGLLPRAPGPAPAVVAGSRPSPVYAER